MSGRKKNFNKKVMYKKKYMNEEKNMFKKNLQGKHGLQVLYVMYMQSRVSIFEILASKKFHVLKKNSCFEKKFHVLNFFYFSCFEIFFLHVLKKFCGFHVLKFFFFMFQRIMTVQSCFSKTTKFFFQNINSEIFFQNINFFFSSKHNFLSEAKFFFSQNITF